LNIKLLSGHKHFRRRSQEPRGVIYQPHKAFGNQKNAGTFFLALPLSDPQVADNRVLLGQID
jgi:hypothetical protein